MTGLPFRCHVTQALEISEFQRRRMDASLQLHSARVELCGLELLLDKHGLEAAVTYLEDVAAPDTQVRAASFFFFFFLLLLLVFPLARMST